jgi:hypothetical protein
MDAALLDTDILNEILKQKNANAIRHAADYPRSMGSSPRRGGTVKIC